MERGFVRTTVASCVGCLVVFAISGCDSIVPDTKSFAKADAGEDDVIQDITFTDTKLLNDAVDAAADAGEAADVPTEDDVDGPLPDCTGAAGCPCKSNGDCDESGVCLETAKGWMCAFTCQETCAKGFSCKQISGASGDSTYVCIALSPKLCMPCLASKACLSTGITGAACIGQGDGGSFCGAPCDDDAGCPKGFVCQEAEAIDGGKSKQCVPDPEGPLGGECSCSTFAIEAKAKTTCKAKQTGGDDKACPGWRQCDEDGLSACLAQKSVAEICDGHDNDCNGTVDDATCNDNDPCTKDACNPDGLGAGNCSNEVQTWACDDGNACTTDDVCAQGKCGGAAKTCADGDVCTDDSCDPAKGCVFLPNTATCTDGNACTKEGCADGKCATTPITCDDGNACMADSCDKKTGCVHLPTNATCSDGDACTGSDDCAEGKCVAKAIDCDDVNPCTADSCDSKTGCVHLAAKATCDDDDACTVGDDCVAGKCAASPKTCDDGSVCTDDGCDKKIGCTTTPKTGKCDDGSACTKDDACAAGKCVGKAVSCDDANPCTNDSCDVKTGCVHAANSAKCDDGDPCTLGDACKAKKCGGKLCDDGNVCTSGKCEAGKGCKWTPKAGGCDDGDPCTKPDACVAGKCTGTGDPQCCYNDAKCNDGNDCTIDKCALASHTCGHEKGTMEGKGCNADDDGCTASDACKAGLCVAGKAVDCSGTADTCNTAKCNTDGVDKHKCVKVPRPGGVDCEDGQFCTVGETCDGKGKCAGAKPNLCDDAEPCTTDACDAKTSKCTHAALKDDAPCNDGNACTKGETCQSGVCTGVYSCPAETTSGSNVAAYRPMVVGLGGGRFAVADIRRQWWKNPMNMCASPPWNKNAPFASIFRVDHSAETTTWLGRSPKLPKADSPTDTILRTLHALPGGGFTFAFSWWRLGAKSSSGCGKCGCPSWWNMQGNGWQDYDHQLAKTADLTDFGKTNATPYAQGNGSGNMRSFVAMARLGTGLRVAAFWTRQGEDKGFVNPISNTVYLQVVGKDGKVVKDHGKLPAGVHEFHAAPFSDGRAILAWRDGKDIWAQIFIETGDMDGAKFKVNPDGGVNATPWLAPRSAGYVIAWRRDNDIAVQLFTDEPGKKKGAMALANTYKGGTQTEPAIGVFADDSFLVSWTGGKGADGDGAGILAQRFDKKAGKVGKQLVVNTLTKGDQ